MKYNVMKKWVKALRSGKYKQGTDYLKNDGKYCCLGVLCAITNSKNYTTETTLPKSVMEKTGMKSDRGNISSKYYLSNLNDTYYYSFKKIANVIEKNWRKL